MVPNNYLYLIFITLQSYKKKTITTMKMFSTFNLFFKIEFFISIIYLLTSTNKSKID
jgi:hypothetical protein